MAYTNLPPQAYTRDVLAAAYEWLRSQPTSIRELATNSDNLVSLYMQSRRRPQSLHHLMSPGVAENKDALSAAGAEAFKNDLKNLAEGLKQFEDPRAAAAAAASALATTSSAEQPPTFNDTTPTPMTAATVAQTISVPAPTASLSLDPRSLDTVRKVQSLFNLGSEREALRLLITVGFEKVKDFIGG